MLQYLRPPAFVPSATPGSSSRIDLTLLHVSDLRKRMFMRCLYVANGTMIVNSASPSLFATCRSSISWSANCYVDQWRRPYHPDMRGLAE